MGLIPGIRTMDALGRGFRRIHPQGRLGTVEHEGRCQQTAPFLVTVDACRQCGVV